MKLLQSRVKIYRIRSIAIVSSVILHILLLLLFSNKNALNLNFLQQTDELISDKYNRITYELINTPNQPESEINNPDNKLASDKNLEAADDNILSNPDADLPFQQGFSEKEKFISQDIAPEQENHDTTKNPEDSDESTEPYLLDFTHNNDKQNDPALEQLNEFREIQADFQNISNSVSAKGGMSFNTYKWDFAPYMLKMKQKIQNNINPPPAFRNMGMISGKNLIRFVVAPSGKLKEVILIGSDTHISLDQTSLAAINSSAPFFPLPQNFPEEFLEVTATFEYFIRK